MRASFVSTAKAAGLAAAAFLAVLATTGGAEARHWRGHHYGWGHHQHWRGHHYGWRRHHYGWHRGHHYGWRHHRHWR
ncbi:hypothetical protein SLNSH_10925 [Alsobacter soli]|uniref:Sulfur globule protein n=1 Tax=Alsobacter soli TaxID=2109933 RepID=A0A2T1HTJ9_9HYPH|nr:hypothetical protein [Alsobacter soli]PSC04954.1 hypothetical protein SLNSH_10925 [Alsobacter soli]